MGITAIKVASGILSFFSSVLPSCWVWSFLPGGRHRLSVWLLVMSISAKAVLLVTAGPLLRNYRPLRMRTSTIRSPVYSNRQAWERATNGHFNSRVGNATYKQLLEAIFRNVFLYKKYFWTLVLSVDDLDFIHPLETVLAAFTPHDQVSPPQTNRPRPLENTSTDDVQGLTLHVDPQFPRT
jgi:hypothetical protein